MAFIKQITVGMSETIDVGNHERVRPSYELTVVMEEGDVPNEISKTIYKEVRLGFLSNLVKELNSWPDRKEINGLREAAKRDMRELMDELKGSTSPVSRPSRVLRIER